VKRASAVVSNLNPKLRYLQLLDPGVLPPAFRQRMRQWRYGSGTFTNVALSELPDHLPAWRSARITRPASSSRRPSHMERAYSVRACRAGRRRRSWRC
jgi:hypothetical protein